MKKYLALMMVFTMLFAILVSTTTAQGPVDSSVGENDPIDGVSSEEAPVEAAPIDVAPVDSSVEEVESVDAPVADEEQGEDALAAPVDSGADDATLEEDPIGAGPGEETAEEVAAAEITGTGAQAGPWSSTIYVSNPNNATATADMTFYYLEGGAVKELKSSQSLNAYGSAAIDVASVSGMSSTFQGSAIVSSDKTLAVQVGLKVSKDVDRMIYTGYTQGANQVSAPAIACRAFDQDSDLVVMNVGATDANVSIKYLGTSGTVAEKTTSHTIKPNSSTYLDVCTELGLDPNTGDHKWLGSATITGGGSDQLVAVVFQPYVVSPKAVAYETLAGAGSQSVYFPSALQGSFGVRFTTFYAIQNVGSSATEVTFDVQPSLGSPKTVTLQPGEKVSLQPKDAGAPETGSFNAAAVATAGSGGQIAGITNIGSDGTKTPAGCTSGAGQTTAFLNPSSGSATIAIPWIEYKVAPDWRSFIAVQNIGSAASGNVTVKYYDANGNSVGSADLATIGAGEKKNTNANAATASASFMGSVVISSSNASDSLIALTNNQQADSCHAASALGVPVQ
jgi:hypothetical protein